MNIVSGSIIKVKKNGITLRAEVLQPTDAYDGYEYSWWVRIVDSNDITVFYEDDLLKWNKDINCDCGGRSTRQPGHSWWCDAFEI